MSQQTVLQEDEDTIERVCFLQFLKACVKDCIGLNLPLLKIQNKFSHLDFNVKLDIFAENILEILWENVCVIITPEPVSQNVILWPVKSEY